MKKWCRENDFLDVDKDIQKVWGYLFGDLIPSSTYGIDFNLNVTRKFSRPAIVQSAVANAKRAKETRKLQVENRQKLKSASSSSNVDVSASPEGPVKTPASSPKFGPASSSSGAPASSVSGVPRKVLWSQFQ